MGVNVYQLVINLPAGLAVDGHSVNKKLLLMLTIDCHWFGSGFDIQKFDSASPTLETMECRGIVPHQSQRSL